MAFELESLNAYLSSDYESAIALADSAVFVTNWLEYNRQMFSPVLPLILKAHSYYALGEYEEAIQWFNAIHFYTRFVELWSDADERFQPYIQDARDGLDRLVLDREREPAS